MIGSGFAYDAMSRIARATEERRANRQYWRKIRRRHKRASEGVRNPLDHPSLDACIAAQLDHDAFLLSARTCPECREPFVLINVHGVEIDTCLECGSFWLDSGEFKTLTTHEEIIPRSVRRGPSAFKCPVCAGPMAQRQLSPPTHLRFDACPKGDGVYFKRDELMKITAEQDTATNGKQHLPTPDGERSFPESR